MIVELKQYPNDSSFAVGLEKYNRSKLPGTFEIVYPAKASDGRYITGIDEDALSINSIENYDLRELRKAEVKKLREELERSTNRDLSATNYEYWSHFGISLNDNFSLNLGNPQEKLKYYVLIANGYAAPEIGVINSPEYYNTKYYVSRKEEEATTRVITKKTKDEARAKLLNLSENRNKLVLTAKFLLGVKRIKEDTAPDIIYEELSNFIDDPKEKRNVVLFLEAVAKSPEQMQYKLTVDEAIRKSVIKVREGYFQRGNATYGKSLAETMEYLGSSEHAAEFLSLKDEVESTN